MIQDFETFIRRGGDGAYTVLLREDGRLSDRAARRSAFDGRLDAVARENEAMLLRVLNAPDTPPAVTPRDLADPSGLRAEVLERWDAWIGPAEDEAVRDAAEERLLRAFAGALNEERQRALGIEGYVWRTRGDGKVRDAHAARSGRLFRWDDVPEGGHPGQDHNCRCVAEPVPEDLNRDIVLADFALPFGDLFGIDPADFLRGLRAATGAGAALLASEVLQAWVGAMRGRRVERVGARLGLDLTTVEGRLAATAYAAVQEGIVSARYPVLPKNSEAARIGGEAAALYELANPGTILETGSGGDRAEQRALQRFIEAAGTAHAQGSLRLRDGDFADGWIEVLPELTEDERRLGQLPGFTPARIEAWLESYTAEELGLPYRTGGGRPDDPGGSVVSTPIPDAAGPNILMIERTQSELDALATDPARGGVIDPKGEREKEIGLGAEAAGLIPGPITRDSTGAAEFIDVNGHAWDVKGFRSDFLPMQGGFEIERAMRNIEKELLSGHNVIVDTGNLSAEHSEMLRVEVDRRGHSDRVVYWP